MCCDACSQGVYEDCNSACLTYSVVVQINERYIPQLKEVLKWPQSIGIVGGRPSSSLYFVGCQGDQVIYLDPHQAQQVTLHALLWLSINCPKQMQYGISFRSMYNGFPISMAYVM